MHRTFSGLCATGAMLFAASQALAAEPLPIQPAYDSPAFIAEDPALAGLIGRAAPGLRFTTLDNQPIDLGALYGRKPVYLKLWATYCIPCRAQMPGYEALYREYGDRIAFVAVDIGFGEKREKVASFVARTGLTMPVVIDDGRLSNWLQIKATPLHVLIDSAGRVAYVGHQDGPALHAALDRLTKPAPRTGHIAPSDPGQQTTLKIGERVPSFAEATASGPVLPARSRQKQAVLFTAPWCESYLKDLEPQTARNCAAFRAIAQRSAATHAIRWTAFASRLWTENSDLAPFQKLLGPNIKLILDNKASNFSNFGVRQIPAIALIDASGHLRDMIGADDAHVEDKITAFTKAP
ncbi:TlpA disulfide reductase family protein [Asaia sp. BMEF1]|uniref:TlpA family protein disulfide reductase n=1 Tax=Asaia sp. BMEF1 TaxID=3155932 RepID=UPI003F6761CF